MQAGIIQSPCFDIFNAVVLFVLWLLYIFSSLLLEQKSYRRSKDCRSTSVFEFPICQSCCFSTCFSSSVVAPSEWFFTSCDSKLVANTGNANCISLLLRCLATQKSCDAATAPESQQKDAERIYFWTGRLNFKCCNHLVSGWWWWASWADWFRDWTGFELTGLGPVTVS